MRLALFPERREGPTGGSPTLPSWAGLGLGHGAAGWRVTPLEQLHLMTILMREVGGTGISLPKYNQSNLTCPGSHKQHRKSLDLNMPGLLIFGFWPWVPLAPAQLKPEHLWG